MDLHCKKKTHQKKCSLSDEDKLLVCVPNKFTYVFSSPTISLVVAQESALLKSVALESYAVETWAKLFLQAENEHKAGSNVGSIPTEVAESVERIVGSDHRTPNKKARSKTAIPLQLPTIPEASNTSISDIVEFLDKMVATQEARWEEAKERMVTIESTQLALGAMIGINKSPEGPPELWDVIEAATDTNKATEERLKRVTKATSALSTSAAQAVAGDAMANVEVQNLQNGLHNLKNAQGSHLVASLNQDVLDLKNFRDGANAALSAVVAQCANTKRTVAGLSMADTRGLKRELTKYKVDSHAALLALERRIQEKSVTIHGSS